MAKQWTPENPSPIENLNSLEFYGQRPWRQGQQGMEILDQQKERDGISCLQELESKENLSVIFIYIKIKSRRIMINDSFSVCSHLLQIYLKKLLHILKYSIAKE